MVHGVDISKLSKEELKYIPLDWRDGITDSICEHPNENTDSNMNRLARATYPNVNNYIKSKKYKASKVKFEYKSHFSKFGYRRGAPEGIVAHETTNNNSAIRGEINYMSRNYNNAFVHSFVDNNEIIKIHPSNYGVWGAGYFRNQRTIQVELVRVHNFEAFAQSVNNYAEYSATML